MPIDLKKIRISSYLMNSLTGGDESYHNICRLKLDLEDRNHRQKLLQFLNKWRCRQFAHYDHASASRGIARWHNNYKRTLPNAASQLLELRDSQIKRFASLFDNLKTVRASTDEKGRKKL